MSVIIDTFEIVADKKNEDKQDNSAQKSTEKKFPQPVDIEAVREHQEWRALRLRAH